MKGDYKLTDRVCKAYEDCDDLALCNAIEDLIHATRYKQRRSQRTWWVNNRKDHHDAER